MTLTKEQARPILDYLLNQFPSFDLDPASVPSWHDDEEYPREDWRYEVSNGDTNLGYAEWVVSQRESGEVDGADLVDKLASVISTLEELCS